MIMTIMIMIIIMMIIIIIIIIIIIMIIIIIINTLCYEKKNPDYEVVMIKNVWLQ